MRFKLLYDLISKCVVLSLMNQFNWKIGLFELFMEPDLLNIENEESNIH